MNLKAINLKKIYYNGKEKKIIINRLNLEISEGKFIAIMGPSGEGKTTLLSLLGALDYPNLGNIYYDDIDITKLNDEQRTKFRLNNIGFIFQNYRLLYMLNVIENVALPMYLSKLFTGKEKIRAQTLLRLVNLYDLDTYPIEKLSGGQKQRVSIARALANNPKIILADEPTGNLDFKNSKDIISVLSSISKNQKIIIIMVTHDPKMASLTDRIYYLKDGNLTKTIF